MFTCYIICYRLSHISCFTSNSLLENANKTRYYGFACVYLGHYVHIRYDKMTLCDGYLLSVNCWSWYPLVVGYGTHTVLSASYQIWQILDRSTSPFYEHFTPFVLAPSIIPQWFYIPYIHTLWKERIVMVNNSTISSKM